MKRTFIKESFLAILATLFSLASSFGQTVITTGAITPTSVCAGSDISGSIHHNWYGCPANQFYCATI